MSIINALKSGEHARLIPILPDSRKEEKATATLLANFRIIPGFAKEVLSEAGASIGSRARIDCYTEVVFKNEEAKGMRPDGLIVVHTGKKEWSALIESKIGNSSLSVDQVEKYLVIAKSLGIDAVITISNEYAVRPTHHPVSVSKQATKKVDLYHFSWLSIISKAILLSDNSIVDDPEQAFLLAELIRYFKSSASGVSAFTKMSSDWRDLCDEIHKGAVIQRNARYIEGAVGSWNQLLRYLSLQLSMATSSAVTLQMPRKMQNDAAAQVSTAIESILKSCSLSAAFEVPNAAAPIEITADFLRRTLTFDMRLTSPQDIKRPTAAINWLSRQLKGIAESENVMIKVHWPKRIPMTMATLARALENPDCLVKDVKGDIPKELEVAVVVDLAGKFRGAKTFIEESEIALIRFYDQIGEHLTAWAPKAPQLKQRKPSVDGSIVHEEPISGSAELVPDAPKPSFFFPVVVDGDSEKL